MLSNETSHMATATILHRSRSMSLPACQRLHSFNRIAHAIRMSCSRINKGNDHLSPVTVLHRRSSFAAATTTTTTATNASMTDVTSPEYDDIERNSPTPRLDIVDAASGLILLRLNNISRVSHQTATEILNVTLRDIDTRKISTNTITGETHGLYATSSLTVGTAAATAREGGPPEYHRYERRRLIFVPNSTTHDIARLINEIQRLAARSSLKRRNTHSPLSVMLRIESIVQYTRLYSMSGDFAHMRRIADDASLAKQLTLDGDPSSVSSRQSHFFALGTYVRLRLADQRFNTGAKTPITTTDTTNNDDDATLFARRVLNPWWIESSIETETKHDMSNPLALLEAPRYFLFKSTEEHRCLLRNKYEEQRRSHNNDDDDDDDDDDDTSESIIHCRACPWHAWANDHVDLLLHIALIDRTTLADILLDGLYTCGLYIVKITVTPYVRHIDTTTVAAAAAAAAADSSTYQNEITWRWKCDDESNRQRTTEETETPPSILSSSRCNSDGSATLTKKTVRFRQVDDTYDDTTVTTSSRTMSSVAHDESYTMERRQRRNALCVFTRNSMYLLPLLPHCHKFYATTSIAYDERDENMTESMASSRRTRTPRRSPRPEQRSPKQTLRSHWRSNGGSSANESPKTMSEAITTGRYFNSGCNTEIHANALDIVNECSSTYSSSSLSSSSSSTNVSSPEEEIQHEKYIRNHTQATNISPSSISRTRKYDYVNIVECGIDSTTAQITLCSRREITSQMYEILELNVRAPLEHHVRRANAILYDTILWVKGSSVTSSNV